METDKEKIKRLEKENKKLREVIEKAPYPSTMGTAQQHYDRFFAWVKDVARPAIETTERK